MPKRKVLGVGGKVRLDPSKSEIPSTPRSNAEILHVDGENFEDEIIGPNNAGILWLGEPFVRGDFGVTQVTRGFSFAGSRALHAATTQIRQRAQIKLSKRWDAPASNGVLVSEFVFRPVKSKPVRMSRWIVWRTLVEKSTGPLTPGEDRATSIELIANGSAASKTYSIDLIEGRGRGKRTCHRVISGLRQNQWTRFILLRDPHLRVVRVWAGKPNRELFVGTFTDRTPLKAINHVLLGDDSSKTIVGSGYWDQVRIGGVLRSGMRVRLAEESPILRFKAPQPVLPIPVTKAKQLFVDDWLLARSRGIKRTLHQFEKYPGNPLIKVDKPWEGYAVLGGGGVFRDESTGEFRLWYKAHNPIFGPPPNYKRKMKRSFTCLATSSDGIHWIKPNLGIYKYKGSKRNNISLAAGTTAMAEQEMFEPPATRGGVRAVGSITHLPEAADPDRRYVGWMRIRGFSLFTSPDGVRWTDRGKALDQGYDATTLGYDPVRRMFYISAKIKADGGRARGYAESADGIHWTDTKFQMVCDKRDLPGDQMYATDHWYHETLHLAFMRMYHHEPGQHRLDIQLMSARDPRHWDRTFREPILVTGDRATNEWDWANQTIISAPPVLVGNEHWVYYSGRIVDHMHRDYTFKTRGKGEDWHWGAIGMAKIRRDGFVSVGAAASGSIGVIETKPVDLVNGSLYINANAHGGEIRVEFTDLSGKPLKGYSAKDVVPITRDSVSQKVVFRGRQKQQLPTSATPVKIRFYIDRASIFTFWTA
ncbi:MAG: hypothetical protein CMJ20_00900 [Phycisphaeraceae bacterium]|nr:hypothetical protein [Phycisphaeraceae bacterium]